MVEARGELLLFLGDDVEAARADLLARHVGLHRQRPDDRYAVLGRVTWSSRVVVTPFMRWLEAGRQFAFEGMSAGWVAPRDHLYTAHLSLKKSVLDAVGGFNERFPYAAVEDIELGVRLENAGLELDYRPDLVVSHDHPTTLNRSLERARLIGRSAALYQQLHPRQPHSHLKEPKGLRWKVLWLFAPAVSVLTRSHVPPRFRKGAWRLLHLASYGRGFLEGPPDR